LRHQQIKDVDSCTCSVLAEQNQQAGYVVQYDKSMVYYFVTDMKHRTHTNLPSSNLLQKSVNILWQHQGVILETYTVDENQWHVQLNHHRPGIFCLLSLRFMHMKVTHNYSYRNPWHWCKWQENSSHRHSHSEGL